MYTCLFYLKCHDFLPKWLVSSGSLSIDRLMKQRLDVFSELNIVLIVLAFINYSSNIAPQPPF